MSALLAIASLTAVVAAVLLVILLPDYLEWRRDRAMFRTMLSDSITRFGDPE